MVELRFYCKLTTQTAGTYAANIHDKQNRMQLMQPIIKTKNKEL